jgi:hypothetical protein
MRGGLLREGNRRIAPQRLLFELELEDRLALELDELLDELFELLLDARRVGWLGVRPTARAARFMPFSQPLKNPCTAVSPRGVPRLLFELLLLDELLLLLFEAFELEFDEELEDEFDDEFELELDDELDDELEDELDPRPNPPPPKPPPDDALPPPDPLEPPLELPFELLLPALMFRVSRLASTPCAACVSSLASGKLWAWALWLPTTLATAVTIAPMLFFMTVLWGSGLKRPGQPSLARPGSDATTHAECRLFRGER